MGPATPSCLLLSPEKIQVLLFAAMIFSDGRRSYLVIHQAELLYMVVFGPSGIGPFSLRDSFSFGGEVGHRPNDV